MNKIINKSSISGGLPLENDFYKFIPPKEFKIKNAAVDIDNTFFFSTEIWKWRVNGDNCTINWKLLNFEPLLEELLKGFIYQRLLTKSPATVKNLDISFLKFLQKLKKSIPFPWDNLNIIKILNELVKDKNRAYYPFKGFYKWGLDNFLNGFNQENYNVIIEIKITKSKSYEKIFLNQNQLEGHMFQRILEFLDSEDNNISIDSFQTKVLIQLSVELAPRPSQIHYIDIGDCEFIQDKSTLEDSYYSIWLPMAKKISSSVKEKRSRKISKYLGQRIQKLIELNKNESRKTNNQALFINTSNSNKFGARLSATQISQKITKALRSIGFAKGDGATLLRHHLAQSLADQGASAEIIAEILGHNSTVPARAYIAATPKIAEIKTMALGKNNTYGDLMEMFLTGKIIEKKIVEKQRWVKGLVGMQYIGDIGVCGLSQTTPCPKNPVYSCYNCKKFQPFANGQHDLVKEGLQKQVQSFINHAEIKMDLQNNRTVLQLKKTIETVDKVIRRIIKSANDSQ